MSARPTGEKPARCEQGAILEASSSGEPLCSVCVANYNGVDWLPGCLDSVATQEVDFPVEVIVHDDASSDDSVALIRERYPEVRLLTSSENVGFCVSNNRMAAIASGHYLLLLNNDARLRPGALKALAGCAVGEGFDGILALPEFDLEGGELLERGYFLDPFLTPVPNLDRGRRQVGMVPGSCLWIPKDLWNRAAGLPEWFGSMCEDLFLCLSVRNFGRAVEVLPSPGYDHVVGASFGGGKVKGGRMRTTYRRRALSERNRTYLIAMFYPLALAAFALPLRLFLLAVEGLLLSMVKLDATIWRRIYGPIFVAMVRERRRLWRERRRIQAERAISASEFWAVFRYVPRKLAMLVRHGLPDVY